MMMRTLSFMTLCLTLSTGYATGSTPSTAINFDAKPGVSKVDLKWESIAEKNVVSYTIERSKDGELWAEIITVNAVGASNSKENFLESDYNPIQGVSYYRLKKTLADGLHAYSNIVVVKNQNSLEPGVSPISLDEKDFSGLCCDEILIVLKDQKGNEFFSKIYVIDQPTNLVGLDLEDHLQPGSYTVTASSNEGLVSLPLVIK
jgi:hypothetical protein